MAAWITEQRRYFLFRLRGFLGHDFSHPGVVSPNPFFKLGTVSYHLTHCFTRKPDARPINHVVRKNSPGPQDSTFHAAELKLFHSLARRLFGQFLNFFIAQSLRPLVEVRLNLLDQHGVADPWKEALVEAYMKKLSLDSKMGAREFDSTRIRYRDRGLGVILTAVQSHVVTRINSVPGRVYVMVPWSIRNAGFVNRTTALEGSGHTNLRLFVKIPFDVIHGMRFIHEPSFPKPRGKLQGLFLEVQASDLLLPAGPGRQARFLGFRGRSRGPRLLAQADGRKELFPRKHAWQIRNHLVEQGGLHIQMLFLSGFRRGFTVFALGHRVRFTEEGHVVQNKIPHFLVSEINRLSGKGGEIPDTPVRLRRTAAGHQALITVLLAHQIAFHPVTNLIRCVAIRQNSMIATDLALYGFQTFFDNILNLVVVQGSLAALVEDHSLGLGEWIVNHRPRIESFQGRHSQHHDFAVRLVP